MPFNLDKRNALTKIDKSRKGSIDEPIRELVDRINHSRDYYTTSSCSGRIVLLEKKSSKKQETKWLFKSHECVEFNELWKALQNYSGKADVWFLFEGLILHVSCRDQKSAEKLLNIARQVFKHSGILSTRKWSIEIMSSDRIETPLIKNGRLLADERFVKNLVEESNKIMRRNTDLIDKLLLTFI